MKDKYTKTLWIDGKTKLDAAKLNNIESGVENLFENALTVSEIYGEDGIKVDIIHDKYLLIHTAEGYYMTAEEVANAIAQAQLTGPDGSVIVDLSGKADKNHTHTIDNITGLREALDTAGITPEQLEQYINSKGYATTNYVIDAIAQAKLDGSDIDLSGKANVGDSYLKAESDAKYQPKGNYLTEHQSLANYLTITQSDAKYQPKGNYLTEHQSLANYFTKDQADNRFQPIGNYLSQSALSNYLSKSESDTRYQSKGDYITQSVLGNYLTETESNARYQPKGNYLTEHQSLANYYTRTQSDSRYQPKGSYLTGAEADVKYQPKGSYLTEAESDIKYQPKGNYLTEHQSLANYYTQSQSDNRYQLKTEAQQLISLINELNDTISSLSYRVSVLENGSSVDTIELIGIFNYQGTVSANGGTINPVNTLKLMKNGVEQNNVEFVYSVNQSYATVSSTGAVTFQSSTETNTRDVTVTVTCIYAGQPYVKTATATQEAFVNIVFGGTLAYSGTVPASGGSMAPSTNTLQLTRNGVAQTVTITYTSNQPYAIVEPNGTVTFSESTTTSQRSATITASCVYEGETYTKTATVKQAAFVPDVIELSGTFLYSGSVSSDGGSVTPTNTLQLLKNGVAQDVTFTYSSNQSYAQVNNNTGVVTFPSNSSENTRTATITASCVYNGQTYSKTTTVTQQAYVQPVYNLYVGSAKNTTSNPWPIESFTPAITSTETIIDYTPTELVNVIIAVCPSTMSLSSCVKHGEIEDNITSKMLASETEVTYEGVTCKMYQFKYGSTIRNNAFTFEFN